MLQCRIAQATSRATAPTLRRTNARKASPQGSYIIGLPDCPIEDVRLEECEFEYEGGALPGQEHIVVPDERNIYCTMEAFGRLPAYGLFARHVKGLKLRNVSFRSLAEDARPAFRYEQCRNVQVSYSDLN